MSGKDSDSEPSFSPSPTLDEFSDFYTCGSGEPSDSDGDGEDSDDEVDLDTVSLCMMGRVKVTVIKGDIASQKVNVIMSGSPGSLDLSKGALSKAIARKAGPSLQTELREKYPNGIKSGEFAISGAGNLKCEHVYHVCIPKCEGDQSKKTLRDVFYKCFTKASSDGHESIAMPALGTGMLNYSSKTVARTVSSVVNDFNEDHPNSSLRNVYCVIQPSQQAIIQAFGGVFKEGGKESTPSRVSGLHFGKISVKLNIGKLTEQQSDVIMGTCTKKLDLKKGSLSKAILEAAGDTIQTECSAKYPQGIQHGEVAVLKPGNLGCTKLYLGSLPRFDKAGESTETPSQLLRKLVLNSLKQTAKDKKSSICMPPFGSGFLRYPAAVSAQTMLQAIEEFSSNNKNVVMTVFIILHQGSKDLRKTLQPFKSAFKAYKDSQQRGASGGSTRTATPDRFTPAFCQHMYRQHDHRPPAYWTSFDDSQSLKEWSLEAGTSNYNLVDVDAATRTVIVNLVRDTWEADKKGHGRDAKGLDDLTFNALKVTNVQRVENLHLFEKYVNQRAQLFLKAGNITIPGFSDITEMAAGIPNTLAYLDDSWKDRLFGEVNECYFFHGTKSDCTQNLLKEGIDVKMAQGQSVFGSAVYMAESSTKADQYTDPRDNRTMTGLTMFLMRASLGQICTMTNCHKFRRAPCIESCQDDKCSHDRYDSIVEEGKFIFREFIVYESLQTYPEYIITYDRVNN